MPQLHIIVCVKQVTDPEAPPARFQIDPRTNTLVHPAGFPPVISPFDEQAVEAALRIKDTCGGKITILSLGDKLLRDVVKKPLAMGADELVLLEDPAFGEGGDSYTIAIALSAAITKIGKFDLIFCGRQAADWDAGQVGSGIAEIMGLPQVTLARKIELNNGRVTVEKVTADGYEVVEVSTPALITVSNELGEARYPTIKGIAYATRQTPIIWKPADIGLDAAQVGVAGRRTQMLKIYQPVQENTCEFVTGVNDKEAGKNLAVKMSQAKLI
jgi:electron transfer flavoprotein beta subunit